MASAFRLRIKLRRTTGASAEAVRRIGSRTGTEPIRLEPEATNDTYGSPSRERRSKNLLQIRERHLQIERGLQRLAAEIAQIALGIEHAEHRCPSRSVAFLGQGFQIGRGRHEPLFVRLDLTSLRILELR